MFSQDNCENTCFVEITRKCNRHNQDTWERKSIKCFCLPNEKHKTYVFYFLEPYTEDNNSICYCACDCEGCENCQCFACVNPNIDYSSCTCKENKSESEEEKELD